MPTIEDSSTGKLDVCIDVTESPDHGEPLVDFVNALTEQLEWFDGIPSSQETCDQSATGMLTQLIFKN